MTDPLAQHLRGFISDARWFGGKGRDWTLRSVRRVGELPEPPPGLRVVVEIAEVRYTVNTTSDGAVDDVELYQLPLAYYEHPQERLSHAGGGPRHRHRGTLDAISG